MQVDTGVSDPTYDLVLVLQQALADCHRYAHFAEDARSHGDEEVASLFEELTQQDRELADRVRGLLVARLATDAPSG
jgi:rubrerythrin